MVAGYVAGGTEVVIITDGFVQLDNLAQAFRFLPAQVSIGNPLDIVIAEVVLGTAFEELARAVNQQDFTRVALYFVSKP